MTVAFGLIAAILGALAIGSVIYLTYKLTTSLLKKYRKKKTSRVLAAYVKELIKNAPTMKFDDLKDDDVILAEYNLEDDELVQDIGVAKETDEQVKNTLNKNGGVVVFE